MDTLSHFVLALLGGYALVKGLGQKHGLLPLAALAFLSVLIDADHFWFRRLDMHNVFVVGFLALSAIAFSFLKKARLRDYAAILAVMVCGHLLIDMGYGQGVALFYPLTRGIYALPQVGVEMTSALQVHTGDIDKLSEVVISPMGVALSAYAGVIFLMIGARRLG